MMSEEQTRESNSLREFITKLGFELKNDKIEYYNKIIKIDDFRTKPFVPIVRLITLIPNTEIVDVKLLYYIMQKVDFNPNGKTIKQLTIPQIQDIKITIPNIEYQQSLLQQINQIEKENEELKREIEALEQQKKEFLDKYLK